MTSLEVPAQYYRPSKYRTAWEQGVSDRLRNLYRVNLLGYGPAARKAYRAGWQAAAEAIENLGKEETA